MMTQSGPVYAKDVNDLLDYHLASVNAYISQELEGTLPFIAQVANHLISLGGKRLRPLLTLASAQLCGNQEMEQVIPLAASLEFIHSATLLHDDVVDESPLRRGKISANAKWNNTASVLVGDFLFSQAFELVVTHGTQESLKILSRAANAIVEGEVLQLTSMHELMLPQKDYLEIISLKTASLFSAACEIGAMTAQAIPEHIALLREFGEFLGIAFQVMDDYLDYTGYEKSFGKPIGADFRDKKVTLPILIAYDQGVSPSFWERVFGASPQEQEDFPKALALLKESTALSQTRDLAQEYIDRAIQKLALFPESPLRLALEDLALGCLSRRT